MKGKKNIGSTELHVFRSALENGNYSGISHLKVRKQTCMQILLFGEPTGVP